MATARPSPLLRRLARRAKHASNAVLGWLAVGVVHLIRLGDADRAANIAGWIMRKVVPILPEHRLGRANLKAAFPEKSPQEIDGILAGVWDNLGRFAIEFANLDRIWDHDPAHPQAGRIALPAESLARFARLRASGKPILVFAAHLANWELSAIAATAYGLPIAILYRPPYIADRLVRRFRAKTMGTLIPTGLDAPMRMANALEQGMHVGMLADQYNVQGVDVTFFGRRTRANPLLAKLARHTGCAIHGVRTIRLPGNRFTGEFTEAIEPVRDAAGEIDVAATTQVITSVIEGWVREYPEQWLWLHRRWR